MKICAIIAEYNPFHNGHLKQIEYVKNTLNAEKIIVIMSGDFTQRGEPAIMNKYTRAKHAVIAGADAVIELPTVFATANAEIFAKGAINVINGISVCDGLCFGVESGEKEEYLELAKALNNETSEYKKAVKSQLETGVSLAKAKHTALKSVYGDALNCDLLSSPNNILGLEYVKACLKTNASLEFFPMIREGKHNDKTLRKGITSATSIREKIKLNQKRAVKKSLPRFVFRDLKNFPFAYEKMALSKIITTSSEEMSKINDCTEGLENRIKALVKDNHSLETLIEKVSTKRYPKTRISRIILANLLGVKEKFVKDCLETPLYASVLAVNNESKDLLKELSQKSKIPLITRKSDFTALKKTALESFELDETALDIYNLITNEKRSYGRINFI